MPPQRLLKSENFSYKCYGKFCACTRVHTHTQNKEFILVDEVKELARIGYNKRISIKQCTENSVRYYAGRCSCTRHKHLL